MDYANLRSIRQISAANPVFSEASLRWHVFNAATNGLASAIVKLGSRILIDEIAFSRWLERGRMAPLEEDTRSAKPRRARAARKGGEV